MRDRRWVIGGIGALGAVATLAGGRRPSAAQDGIVIYAAEDEQTTDALTKLFTAETGIGTEVIRVPAAGTLATRVRAEKAAPKADVFIGGSVEFHEPLATEGLTLPYRSPVVEQAKIDPAFVSPPNNWHGWFMGTLVIILNPERFERRSRRRGWPSRRPGMTCSIPLTRRSWSAAPLPPAAAPTSSRPSRSSATGARSKASTG